MTSQPSLIQETEIESPFGAEGIKIHCPICGHLITAEDDIDLCEHALAAFFDGDLIAASPLGSKLFEDRVAPQLFQDEDCNPREMLSTGSNFIISNLTGGMACGPVWGSLAVVFDAYPESLEEQITPKKKKKTSSK